VGWQAIRSKENFGNSQHDTIENSKRHTSFQWNGLILPKFAFIMAPITKLLWKTKTFEWKKRVSIGMGCNLTSITTLACDQNKGMKGVAESVTQKSHSHSRECERV
jgi:hypothetical protein